MFILIELRTGDVAFPSHQLVLETPQMKAQCGTYKTTSMEYGKTYHRKPAPTGTTENQPSTAVTAAVTTPPGPTTSSSTDKPSTTKSTPNGGSDGL